MESSRKTELQDDGPYDTRQVARNARVGRNTCPLLRGEGHRVRAGSTEAALFH
jgi:hypothetical protein